MSLLEKALHGTKPEPDRGSLFAKANAAKASAVPAQVPAPEETHSEDLAASAMAPPVEVAAAAPQFSLSIDDLAALGQELLSLRDSPDYLLAVFARATEALPLDALALFLPQDDGLALAASVGFPASSPERLPASVAERSGAPGDPLSSESAAAVSSLLGVAPSLQLRGATLSGPDGSLAGQWILADAALESAGGEICTALGELLAASGTRTAPGARLSAPSSEPSRDLAALAQGQHRAVAIALDLRNAFGEIELRVPGILPPAFGSVLADAARRILGSNGAAIATAAGLLGCLFFSSSPLDPDLALFQFRKSLKRSLPLLEGIELPQGRALLLDLSSPDLEASLRTLLPE